MVWHALVPLLMTLLIDQAISQIAYDDLQPITLGCNQTRGLRINDVTMWHIDCEGRRFGPDIPYFKCVPQSEVIEVVDFDDNEIIHIQAKAFVNIQSVERLLLADNRITTIELEAFAGLTNLKELDLERNQLVSISINPFIYLPALEWFKYKDNPITCDCSVQWLRYMNFTDPDKDATNAQCYQPANVSKYSAISFPVTSCGNWKVDFVPQKIFQCVNPTTRIPKTTIQGHVTSVIPTVTTSSSHNLTSPPGNATASPSPISVHCRQAQGYRKPSVSTWYIDCQGNGLGPYVPYFRCTSKKEVIEVLDLNDNAIGHLQEMAFVNVQSVERLLLADNRIVSIELQAFSGLTKLRELNLEGNMLTHISVKPLLYLPALVLLKHEDNPIVCDCSMFYMRKMNYAHEENGATNALCAKPANFSGFSTVDYPGTGCKVYHHEPHPEHNYPCIDNPLQLMGGAQKMALSYSIMLTLLFLMNC